MPKTPFVTSIPTGNLTRQSVAILGLQVTGIGLAYLLQLLLARWMGAPAYGAYTYVFAWASTAALVTGLGLPAAVLRFVPAYEAERNWAALHGLLLRGGRLTLVLSTAISILATGILLALNAYTGLQQTTLWLLGAWSVPVLALIKLQTEILRAARQLVLAYLPMLVFRPLLIGAGAFLLISMDPDLTSTEVLALVLGVMVLVFTLRLVRFQSAFPAEVWQTPPSYQTRTWLRTSLPLFMIASFVFIVGQADLLMVGILLDTTAVGLYRVAARTAAFVTLALIAVNTVTAPLISSVHAREGTEGLRRLVRISVHLIFWPSLVLTIALLFFAEPVLGLFGPEFYQARTALQMLALGHLIAASTGPVGYLLNLTGYQDDSARVFGSAAVANILLNGLLIPLWGMDGAALATAATLAFSNLWLYLLAVKRLRVHASILAVFMHRSDFDNKDGP